MTRSSLIVLVLLFGCTKSSERPLEDGSVLPPLSDSGLPPIVATDAGAVDSSVTLPGNDDGGFVPFPDDATVPPAIDAGPPAPPGPVSPELAQRLCDAMCEYYGRCFGEDTACDVPGSCSVTSDDSAYIETMVRCYQSATCSTYEPCFSSDIGDPPPSPAAPIEGCQAKLDSCGEPGASGLCLGFAYSPESERTRIEGCLARACSDVMDCIYGGAF